MNTLCLDAGNSRLKWGLHDGTRWLAQGALAHDALAALALPAPPQRILACNVAGPVVATAIAALAAQLAAPLAWFKSSATACGVTNGYDTPTQLGADRWAALIGARALQCGDVLVVMAGTATTIDMLDAAGTFRGGLILPGLDLMRSALATNTAGLPEARGAYRELPTNTDDAIVSGALHATLGAIERMASRHLAGGTPAEGRRASADISIVLSGGAADLLAPHLDHPLHRVEHLVLDGLARAATNTVW